MVSQRVIMFLWFIELELISPTAVVTVYGLIRTETCMLVVESVRITVLLWKQSLPVGPVPSLRELTACLIGINQLQLQMSGSGAITEECHWPTERGARRPRPPLVLIHLSQNNIITVAHRTRGSLGFLGQEQKAPDTGESQLIKKEATWQFFFSIVKSFCSQ